MYFSRFVFCILLLVLAGCGTDLAPSGKDHRPPVQCGIAGSSVCQNAPDFTVSDSLGNTVTLSSVLSSPTTSGVVMYFTMWCSVCTTDMTLMRDWIMPSYPNVRFLVIDYVSGSVAESRNAEVSNGFDGSGFTVLADTNRAVYDRYDATMATTVVIDRNGVIRMKEGYKSAKLQSVLSALP
jgi:peroxiredoxin